MEIGFIGLGAMGSGMAKNLLKAGHRLRVWNRSPQPAEALEREGSERAPSPEAAFDADAVVTMLSNDAVIRSTILEPGILDKVGKKSGRKPVHIVSSTISVALAHELEEAHRRAGLAYVAAPVLGRPDVAAAGELNVLAAGDAAAVERVLPVLEAFATKVWPIGAEQCHANLVKLASNFMLASAIETMGEAFALAERHGVDRRRLLEVLTGTAFAAPVYKIYGPMIAERRYEPAGFKLTLGLKDIRQAIEAGESVGAPLPIASLLHDNLVDAVGHGDAEKDLSAMTAAAYRRAGL